MPIDAKTVTTSIPRERVSEDDNRVVRPGVGGASVTTQFAAIPIGPCAAVVGGRQVPGVGSSFWIRLRAGAGRRALVVGSSALEREAGVGGAAIIGSLLLGAAALLVAWGSLLWMKSAVNRR